MTIKLIAVAVLVIVLIGLAVYGAKSAFEDNEEHGG